MSAGSSGPGPIGDPVPVGARAPEFELPDQHGASVSARRLCDTGSVAVIFFPFAHTSVCTDELREVRDATAEFHRRGVAPVAVSCDSMFTLRLLADAEGLSFRLLSDFWPHGQAASAFGVLDPDRGCALRGTFLLDRDGIVRWRTVNAVPDPRSLPELFRYLDEARLAPGTPA